MIQSVYCIEHEEMVEMEETSLGIGHTYSVQVDTGTPYLMWDYEFCEFPLGFAFCSPPESVFDQVFDSVDEESDAMEFLGVWETWCNENDPEFQVDDLTRIFEFLP